MALGTPTQLTSQTAASAATITSPSCTPTSGAAVLIFVAGDNLGTAPTLTPSGFTGAPTFTLLSASARQALFYALWTGSGSGTFGVTSGGTGSGTNTMVLSVVQVTGATGFGQKLTGSGTNISSLASNWSSTTRGASDVNVVATGGGNASTTVPTVNTPTNYTSVATQLGLSNGSSAAIAQMVNYRATAAESSMTGTTTATVGTLANVGVEVLANVTVSQSVTGTHAHSGSVATRLSRGQAVTGTHAHSGSVATRVVRSQNLTGAVGHAGSLSTVVGRHVALSSAAHGHTALLGWNKTVAGVHLHTGLLSTTRQTAPNGPITVTAGPANLRFFAPAGVVALPATVTAGPATLRIAAPCDGVLVGAGG